MLRANPEGDADAFLQATVQPQVREEQLLSEDDDSDEAEDWSREELDTYRERFERTCIPNRD